MSLGEGNLQDSVFHFSVDALRLRALRERESATELAEPPLSDRVVVLLLLGGRVRFTRDNEMAVVHIDDNVLFLETRQLEGRCDLVCLSVFVQVHPWAEGLYKAFGFSITVASTTRKASIESIVDELSEVLDSVLGVVEEANKRHCEMIKCGFE